MPRVHSFTPIDDENAEILILGSMPGRASLAAGEYYAHPQNAFWRIMSELLALDPSSTYTARVAALKSANIALWDVLQSCLREGSLDARIKPDRQIANDFEGFLHTHRKIARVFFNGATAEVCFKKHVPHLFGAQHLHFTRLPSTSPSHAALSYGQKLEAWRAILRTRPKLRQVGAKRKVG